VALIGIDSKTKQATAVGPSADIASVPFGAKMDGRE
jgi:hypothetical protein